MRGLQVAVGCDFVVKTGTKMKQLETNETAEAYSSGKTTKPTIVRVAMVDTLSI